MQMYFPLKEKAIKRMSQCYPKRMVCATWLPWEPGAGTRLLKLHNCYTVPEL